MPSLLLWTLLATAQSSPVDTRPAELIDAHRRREVALADARIEVYEEVLVPGEADPFRLQALVVELSPPRERWVRWSVDVEPASTQPIGGGEPWSALASLMSSAHPSYAVFDGKRLLQIGYDEGRSLWTGHVATDFDAFVRRGPSNGLVYECEWGSTELAAWELVSTVEEPAASGAFHWLLAQRFAGSSSARIRRVQTDAHRTGLVVALQASTAPSAALAEIERQFAAQPAASLASERVESTCVVLEAELFRGVYLPTRIEWTAHHAGTRGRAWLRYADAAEEGRSQRFDATAPPPEIRGQPFAIRDELTGEYAVGAAVDSAETDSRGERPARSPAEMQAGATGFPKVFSMALAAVALVVWPKGKRSAA